VFGKRRRLEKRNPLGVTEAEVLRAVLAMLHHHPQVAWAERMNTGAGRLVQRDGRPGHFVRFAFRGCSDVVGQLTDGRFLAVEVKRPGGRLTASQAAFLELVRDNGGLAFVATSADDVPKNLRPSS